MSAEFPASMTDDAFVGPLGRAVLALEPDVETCREALLVEALVFFGSAIGRTAFFQVSRTRHFANLYVALVGASSRARKGTVRDVAVDLVGFADLGWSTSAVIGGATSGEGIVAAVRDRQTKRRRATDKEHKSLELTHDIDGDGYIVETVDDGVSDKRRVFDEGELSAVFKVASRDGNTLSERLREFYDRGSGQITNKNSPMAATGAHVSINGHITVEELRARLTDLDAANGWGNRFLYCATRRERRLPGVTIDDETLYSLARPLTNALAWVREHEPRMAWDEWAWQRWRAFYADVSDDTDGLVGALCARSEAHVMRLALIYAVADRTELVSLEHLEAALAVWDYSERSVGWTWGRALGSRDADRILEALLAAGRSGLSRTAIRDLFSHDKSAGAIDAALALLLDRKHVETQQVKTGGRPADWFWAAHLGPGRSGTEVQAQSLTSRSVPVPERERDTLAELDALYQVHADRGQHRGE